MFSEMMQRYVSSGLKSSASGGMGVAAAVISPPVEVWTVLPLAPAAGVGVDTVLLLPFTAAGVLGVEVPAAGAEGAASSRFVGCLGASVTGRLSLLRWE